MAAYTKVRRPRRKLTGPVKSRPMSRNEKSSMLIRAQQERAQLIEESSVIMLPIEDRYRLGNYAA